MSKCSALLFKKDPRNGQGSCTGEFYAKSKVSVFANFEVGHLIKTKKKKKMEILAVKQFSVCHCGPCTFPPSKWP